MIQPQTTMRKWLRALGAVLVCGWAFCFGAMLWAGQSWIWVSIDTRVERHTWNFVIDLFVARYVRMPRSYTPMHYVEVSTWFVLFLPLAGVGMVMLHRWRIRRRHARWLAEGKCFTCGYQLLAEQRRCPECGIARAPACPG